MFDFSLVSGQRAKCIDRSQSNGRSHNPTQSPPFLTKRRIFDHVLHQGAFSPPPSTTTSTSSSFKFAKHGA